jgi:WD40 repeat protein
MSESREPAPSSSAVRPSPGERLRRLWRQGKRPDVWQFLGPLGDVSPEVLAEVLAVDQQLRWHAGERVPAEAYLERCPALAADVERALELVYGEFCLRARLGEAPPAEDYVRRFPRYAERLRQQLELYAAVEETLNLPPGAGRDDRSPVPRTPRPASWGALPVLPGREVLYELGRGAMGVVYLGWRQGLRRLEAVKMPLPGQCEGADQVARFRTEGEAAARLQHPNIVPIYEVGESGGRPYLAMEYVDGGSLARDGGTPRPARQAAALVEVVARATHYAHGRGVVHRDLKPANVLLTADGTPKLVDFGLAKLLVGGDQATRSDVVLGTPGYMAPEQAAGRSKGVGPPADVYALGAVLYELLTGRPPFQSETPLETLRQVVQCEPVSPSRLQPKVPRDLETICLKCLQKEPRRRYASAAALADDLGRFLRREPIRARPVGPAGRLGRWCRRYPAVAALAGLVAVLVLVVAGVASLDAWHIRRQLARTRQAEDEATGRLYRSLVGQARASRLSRRVGQRLEALEALTEAARLARRLDLAEDHWRDLRNEAIACLALSDLRVAQERDGLPEGTYALDFDPRLERYARLDVRAGTVSVCRVDDGTVTHRLHVGPGSTCRFSPDGRLLRVEGPGRIRVWTLAGQEPALAAPVLEGVCADFSPDSRQLAVGHADGSLGLYDLARGRELRRLAAGTRPLRLRFDPGGRRLAVAGPDRTQVRDLETGKLLWEHAQPWDNLPWVEWHPDGRVVATAGGDRVISLWDTVADRAVARLEGHKGPGVYFTFNHAGDLLASTDWGGILRLWDPRTGQQLFSTPGSFLGFELRFRADDRLLAGGSRGARLWLWEVAPGPEYRTLVRDPALGPGTYVSLAVHPDGRMLAAGMGDGVGLWDLANGTPVAFIPLAPFGNHVCFDRSGALLVNGPGGLWDWPVRAGPDGVRVGPPRRLPAPGSAWEVACSADGQVVATAQTDRGLVLRRDGTRRPDPLSPHDLANSIAVSPDGRLVATGSYHVANPWVKVWEPDAGKAAKLVRQFAVDSDAHVAFSPDGRWLAATGRGGCRVWAVQDSWREGPRTDAAWGGAVAFSPDGRLLAVETGYGRVSLLDPATGREHARLEDPTQDRAVALAFSPDGTQLLASGESSAIHVWDLAAIRRGLVGLGLDGDGLPDRPAPAPAAVAPLTVTVDRGDLPRK